jgi:hypothetical protein
MIRVERAVDDVRSVLKHQMSATWRSPTAAPAVLSQTFSMNERRSVLEISLCRQGIELTRWTQSRLRFCLLGKSVEKISWVKILVE